MKILNLIIILSLSASTYLGSQTYKFYYSAEQEFILNSVPGRMPMFFKGKPYTEIIDADSVYTSIYADMIYLGRGTMEDVTFNFPKDIIPIDTLNIFNKADGSLWSFYVAMNTEEFQVFILPQDKEINVTWNDPSKLNFSEINDLVNLEDKEKSCILLNVSNTRVDLIGCKRPNEIAAAIYYTFKYRFRK